MSQIINLTHHEIYKDPGGKHCENQVVVKQLSNGELVAVFNEERFPFHHDTGQTVLIRSKDNGVTWDPASRVVVLPWTSTTGNWDCGLLELADGSLIINLTVCGFFKRGIKSEQPSWSAQPMTEEWGDWTWAFRLRRWLGTFVLKSYDLGKTWSAPVQVNVVPLTHAGTRLGCWQIPGGSLLMGVYGRIRGYEEESAYEGMMGDHESTRSALIRSDDGGENWEYYSTLAYDPASIIDYEEPALLRIRDGRLVCFMRTAVNPSDDEKNLAMVVSDDDGFSWTTPKWTNIWGYPAELTPLQDGRYLMVYGYRRPPYGVRGVVSEDGLNWDVKNEFVIRSGGVPGGHEGDQPASTMMNPASGHMRKGSGSWENPGLYQHIGYPSVVQLLNGTIVVGYHEWSNDPKPIQIVLCSRFEILQ